ALALLLASHEQDTKSLRFSLRAMGHRAEVDTVGNHLVAAAEIPLPRPAGRLRDSDAPMELVEDASRAEQGGADVREPLGGIGMEGADHGSAVEAARVPPDDGGDRLVHVYDVETARSQLAPQADRRRVVEREVRDGAVCRDGD